jgi:hypothetical protein
MEDAFLGEKGGGDEKLYPTSPCDTFSSFAQFKPLRRGGFLSVTGRFRSGMMDIEGSLSGRKSNPEKK